MSQRDNFSGGFWLGAILGGTVGGLMGALLASGRLKDLVASSDEALLDSNQPDAKLGKPKNQALKSANGADIEAARRSLEDKIAQLNDAIDDVRQQLGGINGEVSGEGPRSLSREP